MPRFELEKSRGVTFFWEIEIQENAILTWYGRVGRDVEPRRQELRSPAAAKAQVQKLIAEKKRVGWLEVHPSAPPRDARNPDLEAQIKASRDDVELYRVYADWLISQGSPQGELINLQAQMLEDGRTETLVEAEQELLESHERELLGFGIGEHLDSLTLEWKLGFLAAITLHINDPMYEQLAEVVESIFEAPVARLLEEINFETRASHTQYSDRNYIDAVRQFGKGAPETIRCVRFLSSEHDPDRHARYYESMTDLGHVDPIIQGLPDLEVLELYCGNVHFQRLEFRRLQSLVLDVGLMDPQDLRQMATRSWPQLDSLNITFYEHSCPGGLEDVASILEGVNFPKLVDLRLRNFERAEQLASALVSSALLPQLEVLSLECSALDDRCAQILVDNKDRFAHLKHLDLTQCCVSAELRGQVGLLCEQVNLSDQRHDWGVAVRFIDGYE